jgi:hypothetical protein
MIKFTVNHVAIVDKGQNGPWAYGLVNAPVAMADGSKPDVVELRGLGLETFTNIAGKLKAIRDAGKVLTCEAQVRTEERRESFVTKAGEPATKTVVRMYLESRPNWALEVRQAVDEGNLADILGDIEADDASF